MRILHLDSRSILPRVESLYLISRTIVILGIAGYFLLGSLARQNIYQLLVMLGVEGILLGISLYLIRQRHQYNAVYHLATLLIDIALFTVLTRFTGGMASDFYLFYFLAVSLGAYILSTPAISILTGLIVVGYIGANFDTIGLISPMNLIIRSGLICFYAITVNFVADHIRRSEGRLLNLFNTLNKRTSELEKIHVQMEMVYENSRILAGMMDFDEIIEEILKIGEKVLDYPALGIMLVGPNDNLIYRGRLIGGQKNIKLKAVSPQSMEMAYRVAREGEAVRIVDLARRTDYEPLLKSARSAMMVPMITYGKTTGLLLAESPRQGAFEDQDERFLSVLARSAAMAMENAILHRKTEELTIIDDLTGVFNYRYFSDRIKEEKKRAVRYEQPLSLIMVDIDSFKQVNDNYGHEIGNLVLVGLVTVIKRSIRDVDILCRYGGEEFIVILPNTLEREACKIAERIRSEVEGAQFGGGGSIPAMRVTVSVGVSSFPENGLGHEELINAVDQAMYRAKGSGKNAVCTV